MYCVGTGNEMCQLGGSRTWSVDQPEPLGEERYLLFVEYSHHKKLRAGRDIPAGYPRIVLSAILVRTKFGVTFGDIDRGMIVSYPDGTDCPARYPGLVCDCTNDIAGIHTMLPSHVKGQANGTGFIRVFQ